jgi:hypothetical protein
MYLGPEQLRPLPTQYNLSFLWDAYVHQVCVCVCVYVYVWDAYVRQASSSAAASPRPAPGTARLRAARATPRKIARK